jgi:hypothetical protein
MTMLLQRTERQYDNTLCQTSGRRPILLSELHLFFISVVVPLRLRSNEHQQ